MTYITRIANKRILAKYFLYSLQINYLHWKLSASRSIFSFYATYRLLWIWFLCLKKINWCHLVWCKWAKESFWKITAEREKVNLFYTALYGLCLLSGHSEVNCELQNVFMSGSSSELSSHSGGIQSTIAKASKLIQELSTNPITQTERYKKKKRKRDFSRQFQ